MKSKLRVKGRNQEVRKLAFRGTREEKAGSE